MWIYNYPALFKFVTSHNSTDQNPVVWKLIHLITLNHCLFISYAYQIHLDCIISSWLKGSHAHVWVVSSTPFWMVSSFLNLIPLPYSVVSNIELKASMPILRHGSNSAHSWIEDQCHESAISSSICALIFFLAYKKKSLFYLISG